MIAHKHTHTCVYKPFSICGDIRRQCLNLGIQAIRQSGYAECTQQPLHDSLQSPGWLSCTHIGTHTENTHAQHIHILKHTNAHASTHTLKHTKHTRITHIHAHATHRPKQSLTLSIHTRMVTRMAPACLPEKLNRGTR